MAYADRMASYARTKWRFGVFCAALVLLLGIGSDGQAAEGTPPENDLRIDVNAARPDTLFGGMRFFPGTEITVRIEGTVVARRKVVMRRECVKRINLLIGNVCTQFDNLPHTEFERSHGPTTLPVLLDLREPSNQPADAEASVPEAISTPFAADPTTKYVIWDASEVKLKVVVNDESAAALARGLALNALIADKDAAGLATERLVCTSYVAGECGYGAYKVRLIGVDRTERLAKVIEALKKDRVGGEGAELLVDFWLRNKIDRGQIVRDDTAVDAIVDALLAQVKDQQAGDAAERSDTRKALLELAGRLAPQRADARSQLTELLVERREYAQASEALASSIELTRRTYQKAQENMDLPVASAAYLDYARDLTSAAEIAAQKGAGLLLADVQAAASFYGRVETVLDELTDRPNVTDKAEREAEIRDRWLRGVRRFAAVAQLIRSDAALDAAIEALRRARALFAKIEPGMPVAISGDGAHLLTAERMQVSEKSQPELARPAASLELRLLPVGIGRVVGMSGAAALVLDPAEAEVLRWTEGELVDRLEPLPDLQPKQAVQATVAGGTFLAKGEDGSIQFVDDQGTATEMADAQHAVLADDGTAIWVDTAGDLLFGDPNTPTRLPRPNTEPGNWVKPLAILPDKRAVTDPDRAVVLLYDDYNLQQVSLDAARPRGPIQVPANIPEGSFIGAAVAGDGSLIVLTEVSLCVAAAALTSGLVCLPHYLDQVAARLVPPGLVAVGEGGTAVVLTQSVAASQIPGRLIVFDTAPITKGIADALAAGAPPVVDLRAALALRETDVDFEPTWSNALLSSAPTGRNELRLRLLTTTASTRLRSLNLSAGLGQTAVWDEPAFSGEAWLSQNGKQALVVDRKTGRLRLPSTLGTSLDLLPAERVEATENTAYLRLKRDNLDNLITLAHVAPGSSGEVPVTLPSGVDAWRAIAVPARDHGTSSQRLILIGQSGASVRVVSVVPESGAVVMNEEVLPGIAASDIRAVLVTAKSAYRDQFLAALVLQGAGLVALAADSTVLGRGPLVDPTLLADVDAGLATLDIRGGVDRLVVRLTRSPQLVVKALRFDRTAAEEVAFEEVTADTALMLNASDRPGARRQGLGRPVVGYIDATTGLMLTPAAACLHEKSLTGAARGASDRLLPGSLLAMAGSNVSVVGLGGEIRVFDSFHGGRVRQACS